MVKKRSKPSIRKYLSKSNLKGQISARQKYLLFLIFGLVLLIISSSYLTYKKTVLSFSNLPEDQIATIIPSDRGSLPSKITIPDLSISLDIQSSTIDKKGVWEISEIAASFLQSSALPGHDGNTVIYAHNKRTLFGSLPWIRLGSEVMIETTDGNTYRYKVESTQVVSPDQIEVVMPTDYEVLTLYTCSGMLDSKRFVVRAVRINE